MGDLGCVTTSAAVIGGMVVASILTGAGLPFPISIVAWIAITWAILRYIKKNRQRKQQEGTVSFDLGPTAGGPNTPTDQQTNRPNLRSPNGWWHCVNQRPRHNFHGRKRS